MKSPNSSTMLSLGASVAIPRLITSSSGDRTSAAKSTLCNSRSKDSIGKLDAAKVLSVQTLTTIGSRASADWTACATGSDSVEQPTNRTGRGFIDRTNRLRCRRRAANARAIFRHSRGSDSARSVNVLAGTLATTTSSSAIADADRGCPGSTTAISPMCWPAVLTAISLLPTRIETTPARMK